MGDDDNLFEVVADDVDGLDDLVPAVGVLSAESFVDEQRG